MRTGFTSHDKPLDVPIVLGANGDDPEPEPEPDEEPDDEEPDE